MVEVAAARLLLLTVDELRADGFVIRQLRLAARRLNDQLMRSADRRGRRGGGRFGDLVGRRSWPGWLVPASPGTAR